MSSTNGPIVILGAGAVGSYVGGMLSAAGEDVTLVDAWPSHVEAIQSGGLTVDTPEGAITARPRALHLCDAQQVIRQSPAFALLCVKLYDTDWAAILLKEIVQAAPIVTMQNALVEEQVARIAGWNRTLGAIAGTLDVSLLKPGHVRRSRRRGAKSPVFKVGELSGQATPRARLITDALAKVDTAAVTARLWDDRWAKLLANTMTSGLSGISGLALVDVYRREDTRRLAILLGAEALAVGEKLGFEPGPLFGVVPDRWREAGVGQGDALLEAMQAMSSHASGMVEGGPSGTLQDLSKGRRTEVDYFNGFIADRGREHGVATPTHTAIAALIRRMERGEAHPNVGHLLELAHVPEKWEPLFR